MLLINLLAMICYSTAYSLYRLKANQQLVRLDFDTKTDSILTTWLFSDKILPSAEIKPMYLSVLFTSKMSLRPPNELLASPGIDVAYSLPYISTRINIYIIGRPIHLFICSSFITAIHIFSWFIEIDINSRWIINILGWWYILNVSLSQCTVEEI